MVKVNEIFASIQGEGPYVGYKQLFVRFCNCNLKCNYCDTNFMDGKDYNPCELADEVNKYSCVHSVSLTGGEPLLQTDFLKEFLPRVTAKRHCGLDLQSPNSFEKRKIYLETNATLAEKFIEVKPFVDIVSADIKLESATGIKDTYKFHDKFFEACKGVETFAKIVFNNKITDAEIEKCSELGKKYGIELILQPEMGTDGMTVDADFCAKILDKFLIKYENVRLIPQVHKFLNIR